MPAMIKIESLYFSTHKSCGGQYLEFYDPATHAQYMQIIQALNKISIFNTWAV